MWLSQVVDQRTGGAEATAWFKRHVFAFELLIDLLCVCVLCAVVICEWCSCLCGAAHRPGLPLPTPTVPSLSSTDVVLQLSIRADAPSRPPQATQRHGKGGTVGRGRASLIGRLRVMERC